MSSENAPMSSIAVFGRPCEIWPVAALLARQLPSRIALSVIDDSDGPPEPAALTLPCKNPFHDAIGLDAQDLVEMCNGTLGLGVDLRYWQGDGSRFFSAASGSLPAIDGAALHHIMLRAAHMYEEPERLDYLLRPFRFAARAVEAGKLSDAADDPGSPVSLLGPTVQCDREAYGALLRERVPADVVQIDAVTAAALDMDPESEMIRAVMLDDGQEIAADLFIDVSGRLSNLLPSDHAADRQPLSDILAFDRCLSGCRIGSAGKNDHTLAQAIGGGLLVTTPLRQGAVSELLFRSEDMDDERAHMLVGAGGTPMPFTAHFCKTPWIGNLARLGGASAQLGPYLSADMRLLHEQALLLARHIPAMQDMAVEALEFNRKQRQAARQLRDFIALPFVLNRRGDAPWQTMRAAVQPESLTIRLRQFRSRGRFVTFDHELFDRQTWIDMMIGFGVVPERYDPIADAMDMRRIAPILKRIADDFTRAIEAMPDRREYLERYAER